MTGWVVRREGHRVSEQRPAGTGLVHPARQGGPGLHCEGTDMRRRAGGGRTFVGLHREDNCVRRSQPEHQLAAGSDEGTPCCTGDQVGTGNVPPVHTATQPRQRNLTQPARAKMGPKA